MRRRFLLLAIVTMAAVAPGVTRTSARADSVPELSPAPTSARFT